MSARLFTGSMIFVFERSFAVGRCPSIHMYAALIFATSKDLLRDESERMREDSRKWSRNGPARLKNLAPGAAGHDLVFARRLGAVHGRVGAPKKVVFLLLHRA